jgi:phospholipid/cholesterol/gamma-HCH transport system ATP-binding protein
MKKEEAIVTMKEVYKSFGGHKVLDGASVEVLKGENLVILGKSGTGKSVLIKCLVSLMPIDKGSMKLFGKEMTTCTDKEVDEVRRKVGFLFQGAALYDSMSVRENLKFPLIRLEPNLKTGEVEKRIQEALENVGLADAADKMPSELSGGMRKRIGLARTIIMEPDIILYDEPTTGLDTITSREISLLIVSLQKKFQTSSIIITHDMECAKMTANRVVVLSEGKEIAEGSYEELRESKNELVRSFFTA